MEFSGSLKQSTATGKFIVSRFIYSKPVNNVLIGGGSVASLTMTKDLETYSKKACSYLTACAQRQEAAKMG